ncbi:MAG: hypothetical protein JJ895_15825 [Balneolaceae bacterium]|nr:hypothetical protein [Balneolaceae bacterium]
MRNLSFLAGFIVLLFSFPTQAQRINSNTFGAIEARQIGPAVMSGRIAALDAVNSDDRIIYVGAASGGVWKSTNRGLSFEPIFDDYIMSIGAIDIDQKHPDTVWVGTGEPWPRNSTSVGMGVYKTTDGGESWKFMGLENSERISRIIVHPEDPNVVYVAALGTLWAPNSVRGVYKTTDGGQSWMKVLFVDENTGAADISIDPNNPDILYAGMWDFRRKAWTFRSGGSGSGLYKSTDGGIKWTKLSGNGLPEEELGRIAVSASPVVEGRVYALIEAKEEGGLYRSDDFGATWEKKNSTTTVKERPFYFSNIYADPIDSNTVYKPSFNINVSKDAGETFTLTFAAGGVAGGGNIHVDHHAFYVSPEDNQRLYLGTDGGLYVSNDGGATWQFSRDLPISQFYHVNVDNQTPYWVYGGLQDNGSWAAPNVSPGGIENKDWVNLGGGDGFNVFTAPDDPNIVFWQSQGGNVRRSYRDTRESKDIKPFKEENTDELRFNWNTPILFSPDGERLYVGAQYVYVSEDMGDSWTRISGDLTTNNPEKQKQYESGGITIDNSTAENNTTIFDISESPFDEDIIWVGTDDGNIQVTRNGGKNWSEVSKNIANYPEDAWVSSVTASKFSKSRAYVTVDAHRVGNMGVFVYKTDNYGKDWTLISDVNIEGYAHKLIEDLENENLLFLGTEFGLYVSFDQGAHWVRFKGNLPKVSVRDLVIHPEEDDLVLGTHGRGIMIIDDISPLRGISAELLQQDVAFLQMKTFLISGPIGFEQTFSGDGEFSGNNPSQTAEITYYLKRRHIFGDMFLEIYDEDGNFLKKLPAGKRKGINRVSFNIRKDPPKVPRSNTLTFGALFGPAYPPGSYTVKLVKGDEVYESEITLQFDPDSRHTEEDRRIRLEAVNRAYDILGELGFVDGQVVDVMDQIDDLLQDSTLNTGLTENLKEFHATLDEIHKELVATQTGGITGEEKLRERISNIYGSIVNYQGRPTETQVAALELMNNEVLSNKSEVERLFESDLFTVQIQQMLADSGKEPIVLLSREEFFEEDE